MLSKAQNSHALSAVLRALSLSAEVQLAIALALDAEALGHSFLDLADPSLGSVDVDLDALWQQLCALAKTEQSQAQIINDQHLRQDSMPQALLLLQQPKRVYLRRHWCDELALAGALTRRVVQPTEALTRAESLELTSDLQSAARALHRFRFAIVSGGPGTGKTTSAAMLALQYARDLRLAQRNAINRSTDTKPGPLQIVLAAPTGKAVARLSQAFMQSLREHSPGHDIDTLLAPVQASTVHRMLGYQPNQSHASVFAHDAAAPINADLIVLDEASMLSLDLMRRVLDANLASCAVLLLGDARQLPAIQCGKPFADLASALAAHPSECVLQLQRQWRTQGALNQMAAQLRDLDITDSDARKVCFEALKALFEHSDLALAQIVQHFVQRGDFDAILRADSLASAWRASQQRRILTPLRIGPQGQIALNQQITRALLQRFPDLTEQREAQVSRANAPAYFQGQLLQATVNQAELALYNGDMLLAWPDADGNMQLYAEIDGELCAFDPSLVRDAESAFVITIHKAQGSEFDAVDILLPALDGMDAAAVIDRTMLYTALTRARHKAALHGAPECLAHALQHDQNRHSGLADMLRAMLADAISS
jgi:exodeoxyribonuclease V alpha subunit